MSIVVMGAVFVDIKGYPLSSYIPGGRNAGRVVQVHGGVSRNIVEDIANVELRPTFVSLVDNTSAGADIVKKLQSHKVDTRYIRTTPDGMGMWLAIFDNTGDVTASISKRPDLSPIADILDEQGDEIFSQADSILLEIDMEKDIVKRTFALAEKHRKPVYAVVSNMSIAIERRDFLRSVHCFICNQQEAGILFSENYDGLTPDEMLPILRDTTERYSKLYSHLHVTPLKGKARQNIAGAIPEAVWTEATAKLNELDIDFSQIEMDGYMVGGFVVIPNSTLEDDDNLELLATVIDYLGQAIGNL